MMSLKVLISHNKLPHIHDLATVQYKKILLELQKKSDLKIIWVIHPTEETSELKTESSDIIDAGKYNNAVEILQKICPDIIMINGSMDFHNVTMALAARYMKIPLVTIFFRNFVHAISTPSTKSIRARMRRGFSNPKFYVKQYVFLIRTLQKINYNPFRLIKFVLFYTKSVFFSYFPINHIISGDINLCRDNKWNKKLTEFGFDKLTIFEVGDPYFDSLFKEMQNVKKVQKSLDKKIKILFCTSTMAGHGFCSQKEENNLIIDTINKILENDSFDISLKMHPSTISRKDYENEVLPKLRFSIPFYQQENLAELVSTHDIMLTYGGTGAIHYGILMGKPIVNLDFNTPATANNVFVDNKIITQCKSLLNLVSDIQKTNYKVNSNEDVQLYIEKHIGIFDGKSSERSAKAIFDLIDKKINSHHVL